MADQTARLSFGDRLAPLKRFLYPVLMIMLAAFACTGFPLPVAAQGWPLIALTGLALLALTFYWFDRVGPRLHEREWQKFAAGLKLSYEPRGPAGAGEAATRVSGCYRGRQVSLETFRLIGKGGGRERFFMHCAAAVAGPADRSLALHSAAAGQARDGRKGQPLQSGETRFDRRFRLDETQPADLAGAVFQSRDLRQRLVRLSDRRPIWLRLKDGQLVYQDQRSQFFGAEMDRRKLMELLDSVCELGEALEKGPASATA